MMMAAMSLGGGLLLGLQALGVMTVFGAIILFGGRSKTMRGPPPGDATRRGGSGSSTSRPPRSPAWP